LAVDPDQAGQLDCHEQGPAADQQFVQGSVFDQGTALLIQHSQGGAGTAGGVFAPPAQLCHAGGAFFEEQVQLPADQGQADALGHRHAGELGQLVRVEDDGPCELLAKGSNLVLKETDLIVELLDVLKGVGALQAGSDGVGLAVKGLSRLAAP
jgi:hypothetical protein